MNIDKHDLIAFEEEIAAEFNASKIRAPIHLYYGNEAEMIGIFKDVRPQDWVLCSWRSQMHLWNWRLSTSKPRKSSYTLRT